MLVLGGWAVGIWASATEQSINIQALVSTSFRKAPLYSLACRVALIVFSLRVALCVPHVMEIRPDWAVVKGTGTEMEVTG